MNPELTLRTLPANGASRRRIAGIVAPYNETIVRPEDGRLERYAPGAFSGYLTRSDRQKVVLIDETGRHAGHTLGVEVGWQDTPAGLVMEFELVDSVRSNEVADLADMGALWGLSAGFRGGTYRTEGDTVVHTGVEYFNHAQITSRPVYKSAEVLAVRSENPMQPEEQPIEQPAPAPTPTPPAPAPAQDSTELDAVRSEVELLRRAVEVAGQTPTQAAPVLEEMTHRSAGEFIHDYALARSQGTGLAQREARERIEAAAEQLPELRALDAAGSATGNLAGAVPDVFMGPIVDLVRNGAPLVNALGRVGLTFPLPAAGMDIHRPKVSTGTSVAWEASEGDEPAATALATTDVVGAIKALKGRFRLTLQAATRSTPSAIDAALRDQAAAVMAEFGNAVLNGTGTLTSSTGTLAGILANGSIQTTGTVGSFTAANITAAMAEAEELAWGATNRAPLFWVMHSRRFSKLRGLVDGNNRPIMQVSRSGYATDVIGTAGTPQGGSALGGPAQPSAELYGYPVVIDNNIPIDLGGSSDQDLIGLVGPESFELFHESTRQLQLQVPDDFQTTFGMAKLGALLPIRPDAFVTITGAGLT